MKKKYKETPLILVFYIDREMISDMVLINPFIESVNKLIEDKEANILAFFVPCDYQNERIEVLNPVLLQEPELDKINALIEDIRDKFSIGASIDYPEDEIEIPTEEIKNKECVCGNNPNGNCKCE